MSEDEESNGSISRSNSVQIRENKRQFSIHREMLDVNKSTKTLDDVVAKSLLDIATRRLVYGVDVYAHMEDDSAMTATGLYYEDQIRYICKQIVFKLSLTNPETIYARLITETVGPQFDESMVQNKQAYESQLSVSPVFHTINM
jgi:hypothetical protein